MFHELVFEPLSLNHVEDIFQNNIGNIPSLFRTFESLFDTKEWVENTIDSVSNGHKLEFTVFTSSNYDFVGMVSVRNLYSDPEYGIWITPLFQGRELGVPMIRYVSDEVWRSTEAQYIKYSCVSNNYPSMRLAKKLNFEFSNIENVNGELVHVFINTRPLTSRL